MAAANALSEPRGGESKGVLQAGFLPQGLLHTHDDGIVVLMAWVYLLRCGDDSLYVGVTADLAGRIDDHQAGKGGAYTSRKLPVVLVHSEELPDLRTARARERQIKRWTLQKKQALIRGDFDTLRRLARRTEPKD